MNIDQITNELKNLSDKINLIDNNVKFNIQIFWGVLALIVAVLGIAIYFLVKQFINHTIETELDKKLKELKQGIIKEITYEDSKIELVPLNGWSNTDYCQKLVCWKDKQGYTNLEGIIVGGITIAGSVLIFFPNGFEPNENITMPIVTDNGIGKIVVKTDRSIVIENINSRRYLEINIKFKSKI